MDTETQAPQLSEITRLAGEMARYMRARNIGKVLVTASGCDQHFAIEVVVAAPPDYQRYLTPPPAFFEEHWPPEF